MKNTIRILSIVLAMAMLMTGCKIMLPGTPDVAATYEGGQITTGEYLTHLFLYFDDTVQNMQYDYNLYQYLQAGEDPWTSPNIKFPYTQADGTEVKLDLETYIRRMAEDSIKRTIVLEKMMKDNGTTIPAEELELAKKALAERYPGQNPLLGYGISDESLSKVFTGVYLNEYLAFMGTYGELDGKKGPKAVADADIRKYFDTNYLSYKIINVSLTKSEKQSDGTSKTVPMTEAEKNAELKKLEGYLAICNEKGFEAAMDAYKKDTATDKTAKIEPSTDEQNRQNADATTMTDEALVKAIRSVEVGKAKIVEYGGTEAKDGKEATPNTTAALIVRMDINKPDTLYKDSQESILYSLKYEEFEKAVKDAMAKVVVNFDADVLAQCGPKDFIEE